MTDPREPTPDRAERSTHRLCACVAAGLLAAWGAGCAPGAGAIFEPPERAPAWPEAPEQPRIRYLGQLRSDEDLKPARGPAAALGELLFGKEPAQSMLSPIGVCTDGKSRVFVADSNAQVVHVFNLDSREYARWRPPPEAPIGFSQPVAVAFDPSGTGRILVSDSVAGVLLAFDASGTYTGTLGAGSLQRPCGLVVDAIGRRVFVADAAAHQVVMLSLSGEEIGRLGGRGSEPGRFNYPTNVALDSQRRLYVSDSLNFRVQVFSPDLQPLAQVGRKGDLPGYFSQPKGLAVDAEDHLYVVDANFEAIQVFDSGGQLLLTFGREGGGPGQFWLPSGLCMDPAGRLWVADSYNRRVQVFQYLPQEGSP